MTRAVLDTSVLVGGVDGPLSGELAISVVSLCELQFGVLVARDDVARAQRLRRLSMLQRRFDALPVDEAVADSYAELAAHVVRLGRQRRARAMDLLIAATAHAHRASLYTRDATDFQGLEDHVDVVLV